MTLADYLWLVRLIIEILKAIAAMPPGDRLAISQLRKDSERPPAKPKQPKTKPPDRTTPPVT